MKKLLTIFAIFSFVMFGIMLVLPMPHGGTLGTNMLKSAYLDMKEYNSDEAKARRLAEKEAQRAWGKKVRESWERFERENPQFYPAKKEK